MADRRGQGVTGTLQPLPGLGDMSRTEDSASPIAWLVCNAASGSNDDQAVAALQAALAEAGFALGRTLAFPDEPAPTPAELDAAGVELLALFGGDGTIHSAIEAAAGWSGAVLPLPGGTMNILVKRLHGEGTAPEIVARLDPAALHRVRPAVIRTRHGMALTGVLAGPGAIWNEVREAMRAANVLEIVSAAREAIRQSTNGAKVMCSEVDGGREEGYAAITVTPHDDGLEANGYYADSFGDYAGQGIALLNRNFRNGPHDDLGRHPQIRLTCPEGEPMGLLIDGEPFDGGVEERFEPMACPVELVATHGDSGSKADAR